MKKYIVKNFKFELKTFKTREGAEQYISRMFKGNEQYYQIVEVGEDEAIRSSDPLEALVKTPEEIGALEEEGIVRPRPKKRNVYRLKNGKTKLRKIFDTYMDAVAYAEMNTSNHPELHWTQIYKVITEVR